MNKILCVVGACVAMAMFSVVGTGCAAESGDEDESVGNDEAAVITPGDLTHPKFSIPDWLDNTAQRARTQCRFTRDASGQLSGPYGLVGFHVDVANQTIVNVQVMAPHAGTPIGRCVEQSVREMRVPPSAPAFGRDKRFTIEAPGKG